MYLEKNAALSSAFRILTYERNEAKELLEDARRRIEAQERVILQPILCTLSMKL